MQDIVFNRTEIFPFTVVILISAPNELYIVFTRSDIPLNVEITIIKTIVPIAIPPNATPEIMLIALCDFLDTRYRRAINRERVISGKSTKDKALNSYLVYYTFFLITPPVHSIS